VHPGTATYLAWLDFRDAVAAGVDPQPFLVRHAKVALEDGRAFGTGGAGFLRLNLATSRPVLTEAVRRIASAL